MPSIWLVKAFSKKLNANADQRKTNVMKFVSVHDFPILLKKGNLDEVLGIKHLFGLPPISIDIPDAFRTPLLDHASQIRL